MTEATAAEYRDKANQCRQEAIASFDRCDTDGFVSQWASGIVAAENDLKAWLAENDGADYFAALFDLDGNLVPAKLIEGRYGLCWGLLESDDPTGPITRFVSARPKRATTMINKGFYEGTVRCAAYVAMAGSGTGLSGALTVRPYTRRKDRGFSRDVEIIDNGHVEVPEGAPRGGRGGFRS